jgi:methyl coenzyme M reductase gamma subunit
LEGVSYRLVLLEEYALDDLRGMVQTVARAVTTHAQIEDPLLSALPGPSEELETLARVLRADHVWFRTSIEQLEWFFSIVERDDHGGHRQALGQYGRILAESLRRHRTDERELVGRLVGERRAGRLPSTSANRN